MKPFLHIATQVFQSGLGPSMLPTNAIIVLLLGASQLSGMGATPPDPPTTMTPNGAWCWFQDPRAVFIEGTQSRTYAGWMTAQGQLQLGAFNHRSGRTEIITLKEDWDVDDHNTCSLLALPDHRLMVFYARHNKRGLYCRTSVHPEDIQAWQDEITISDTDRITYSHPVYLSEEQRFYVFWRGPTWKPTYAVSNDGRHWSAPQILIQEEGREAQSIRPYLKVGTDGRSHIHFAFTDGHPRNEPENSVYYLGYHQGQLQKADGTLLQPLEQGPVPHRLCDRVYQGSTTDGRAWVWDVASDAAGNPVIAYTRHPSETDHRYHYAAWDGKAWQDSFLTEAGRWFPETPEGEIEPEPHYSGGLCLDPSNPHRLFLARQSGKGFQIEAWYRETRDKAWHFEVLTPHPSGLNVRPVVPRGSTLDGVHLLWMRGPYEHYTRYGTGIVGLLPREP